MVTNKDIKAVQAFEDQVAASAKNAISDMAKEMLSAPVQPKEPKPEIKTIADVKKAIGREFAKEFEPIPEKETAEVRDVPCGYCGSMKPMIPYEEMYGPGAHGHDCCPDCGGV